MKCKNCYATVKEFLKVRDYEISQLKSTIECMTETAKDASTRVIADQKEITQLKAMLSALPTTNTVTVDRAEYEAIKVDIKRMRIAIAVYWREELDCNTAKDDNDAINQFCEMYRD